jgi:hypothetical protein
MKTTVYLHDLHTQFHQMGRGDQFSYDGLRVLFEALSNTKTIQAPRSS